jgi:hypothetical protein
MSTTVSVATPDAITHDIIDKVPGTITIQIGDGICNLSPITPGSPEEKSLDLVAELAQMKAMMEQMRLEKEQMRLDKERFETEANHYKIEAKRKEEEEAAALKMEQERELAIKEKKELDVMFSLFRDARCIYFKNESFLDFAWKNAGEEECKFLRSLEASGETILFASLNRRVDRCHDKMSGRLDFILTNCHLYICIYKWVKNGLKCKSEGEHGCGLETSGIFHASPVYSFTNPLKAVHAKILASITSAPTMGGLRGNPGHSLLTRIAGAEMDLQTHTGNYAAIPALKKFESIIRLIPGSYKNGSWRQLDGFFGMYFNETTMEVSELPPPHE